MVPYRADPRRDEKEDAFQTESGQSQLGPPPLTDDDVRAIVETAAQRVVRLCERRGLFEAGATDPLWEQEPLLAQISAASVQGMVATGDRAGRKVRRRLTDPEDGVRSGALCYAARGFSLHAATRIEATDRRQLERLNLVRYHGVLAPASPDRAQIVPGPSALTQTVGCEHASAGGRRCHRVSWAKLLARVFQYDVTVCPSCAGHMQETSGLHHCCPHCAFCGGGFSQRGRPAIQSPTHRPGSPGSPIRIRRSCLSRRRNGRRLERMGLCPNSSAWTDRQGRRPLTHQKTAVHQ